MQFSEKIITLAAKAELELKDRFAEIDRISFENTKKIMYSFKEHRVSEAVFNPWQRDT